jgi:acyl carrier protein
MNTEFIQALEEILDVLPGSLDEASDFKELPEWDSLAALSVMVKIEDSYKKVIDPSVLKNSRTIGELIANIKAS